MLSDSIRSVRENLARATPDQRSAVHAVFGGESILGIWESGARDLEVAYAAIVEAMKPRDGDGDIPVAAPGRTSSRQAKRRDDADFIGGQPGIARRYGQADGGVTR